MKIAALKERHSGEARVAMTPDSAQAMQKLGHECLIESGAGQAAGFSDRAYREAGVKVVDYLDLLLPQADAILAVRRPEDDILRSLVHGQTLISFFWPGEKMELLKELSPRGITLMAMDQIPRISRAQKMDALSSMANIAGYRAVIEAASHYEGFFAGQVTAAGKSRPARVLVIGTGVAGLAAIGAANGLGAEVKAFDVRPEAAEQVESMGAKFLMLDFKNDQDSSATGGYAAPSSPEFRAKQLECFRAEAPETDILICTALIPGRDAPQLWLKDMVEAMPPGSVIVDLAAERGGNCELTHADEVILSLNNVTIVGYTDMVSRMARQSSSLYANNVYHLIADLTPEKDGKFLHHMDDDVIRSITLVHQGEVTYPPPPLKTQAIAPPPKAPSKTPEETLREKKEKEAEDIRHSLRVQLRLLAGGGIATLLLGQVAPPSFMQHFIVFALACFVGFQVIWNVNHALHTPLMAVTNAISGIIVLGAVLQIGSGDWLVMSLAALSILMATINIVGGFLVTRRMLSMFKHS